MQGDQIGRIFAHWAIGVFGQFFVITELALIMGNLFTRQEFRVNFDQK
jgi:hypothetical protein